MNRSLRLCVGAALLVAGSIATRPVVAAALDDDVNAQLEGLGSPSPSEREAAEAALERLAKSSDEAAERVLALLPAAGPTVPAEVTAAVDRVRIRVQRGVALRATAPSRVTLRVTRAPLAEVLAEFERQTGARLVDNRAAVGGDATPTLVTLDLADAPFWQAIDALLDEADLSVYPFGEAGELSLVTRSTGESPRRRGTAYAGPFRFEATSLATTRGLRDAGSSRLDIEVEAAWEPRLRPIALSMPMSSLVVETAEGGRVAPRNADESIDLEATTAEQLLTMTLSLALPDRRVKRLERVAGEMTALVPATRREFRFAEFGAATLPATQSFGAATVTVRRFAKAGAVWELDMELRLADPGDALASHRGWVFDNPSYLQTPEGERIEHAGFETTLQRGDLIGLVYLFDLGEEPPDPKRLTWVYETPSGVHTIPVRWELGPLELP